MISSTELRDVFDRHADRLVLIARSIGEPAEDAVQEAFIALAAESVTPQDPLAWLVRVTRNRLLQWYRSDERRRRRERTNQNAAWFAGEILLVDYRLDALLVTQALQDLDRHQRETIVMHLWGEMTFEQISEVTGVSRATAHRHYTHGLHRLRNRFGVTTEIHLQSPSVPS